jgi:hypothetical protein
MIPSFDDKTRRTGPGESFVPCFSFFPFFTRASPAAIPFQGVALCAPEGTHGPLKVSPNGRYLTYSDGTPFFYSGDTAVGIVLTGSPGKKPIITWKTGPTKGLR